MTNVFRTKLVQSLITVEGAYSNDPDDLGGETIWGITATTARRNGYKGPMRSMSREIAIDIYEKEYWIKPGFADVFTVSAKIAEELFEAGVNIGTDKPGRWLQENLNFFNNQGTLYPDILEDGQIGLQTLSALKQYLAKRGGMGTVVMLRALNADQFHHYKSIGRSRAANEKYAYGWVANRVIV